MCAAHWLMIAPNQNRRKREKLCGSTQRDAYLAFRDSNLVPHTANARYFQAFLMPPPKFLKAFAKWDEPIGESDMFCRELLAWLGGGASSFEWIHLSTFSNFTSMS